MSTSKREGQRINTETFAGLAFTTAKVRYAGPTNARSSRWIATITRGQDTTRVIEPYDSASAGGARNALPTAQACFEKVRKAIDEPTYPHEWIAIPGELDADTYAFTFVPAEYLNREA
jgi:hypothetical protein